ncbi:MAG: alpha-glucan family phosphorylase [Acidobacteriota bacterium]
MAFQIRPVREFLVRAAVPPELARLPEIGANLVWSWNHSLRALFRRLDPVAWRNCNHNPVLLLGQIPQEALERAARDPRYLSLYRKGCEIYDNYVKAQPEQPSLWHATRSLFGTGTTSPSNSGMLVAYFSMEYGLLDCLPIYSGGLGVLSGDHLKASSDLSLPLVGIGLLYQRGYLRQSFDADGWQQEKTPINDFYSLPITPVTREDGSEMLVDVLIGSTTLYLKVWRIDVGRVKLYLLDSNISQNANPEHRDITAQLYAGGQHKRISQEIALGIGGLRILKELGLKPTVYHMNEGHSAFLAIERIRILMAENELSFAEALEASRVNSVFTTHTPVPAGIDLFDAGLMHEYLNDYCQQSGIEFADLLALGRLNANDPAESFSMAVCAIRTSAYRNAVSRLHRDVSQSMWDALWPELPVSEIPITYVTNGVHLPSWINGDFAALYDQHLDPEWREGMSDPKSWDNVLEIPDAELWEAHRRRKRRLVKFIRERAVENAHSRNASSVELRNLNEVLDPEALTIGFARRFATYKRATLIFRDLDRLAKILSNTRRPVQLVMSGKAHPLDTPGRSLIRDIIHHSFDPELARRVIFVEDYGMQVARELVAGVDIWLNTPRRGEEACGTSGMKAGMNGVLNVSILDGWFDEAAEESGGWVIGDREPYEPERDDSHAASIYSLLENEVIPMYYEHREHGVPVEWVRRMKQSLKHISQHFNCQRMVGQYRAQLYEPSHAASQTMSAAGYQTAQERVRWSQMVSSKWPLVRFINYALGQDHVSSGTPVPLRVELDLAGLTPGDVRVEAMVGRVSSTGELLEVQIVPLAADIAPGNNPGSYAFRRDLVPPITGRLGVAVRISTNHFEDPLTRPCNSLLKWAAPNPG